MDMTPDGEIAGSDDLSHHYCVATDEDGGEDCDSSIDTVLMALRRLAVDRHHPLAFAN